MYPSWTTQVRFKYKTIHYVHGPFLKKILTLTMFFHYNMSLIREKFYLHKPCTIASPLSLPPNYVTIE